MNPDIEKLHEITENLPPPPEDLKMLGEYCMKPIGERMASVEAKQGDFDRWNEKQNGRLDRMDDKLGLIHRWLLALMGSVSLGLILTIVGIIVK